jgi:fatty acid synthase
LDWSFVFGFSGRDENGNRVKGIFPSKDLATILVMDDIDFLWSIHSNWSMEEASTILVAYATAYYALIIRGKLKRRESVLIH